MLLPANAAVLALPLLLCPPGMPAPDPIFPSPMDHPWPAPVTPTTSGPWLLSWDDTVDGVVGNDPHMMVVDLRFIGDRVAGHFVNSDRNALFTGSTIGMHLSAPMLRLRQDEVEYTCIYDAQRSDGGWLGTWRDTKGRDGDFSLAPVVTINVDFTPSPITIQYPPRFTPGSFIPHMEIVPPGSMQLEFQHMLDTGAIDFTDSNTPDGQE